MTDLPIIAIPPAPAPAARPTANALRRAAPVRDGAPQPGTSPFQDVLALELGLAFDGSFLPDPGLPAAAAKTDSSLEPGEDTAQAAIAADAALRLALAGLPPLPPGLVSLAPPPMPGAAPLSSVFASAGIEPDGLASDPRKDPLGRTPAAQEAELQSPIGSAAADFAVPGKFSPAAAGEIARTSATQKSELQLPVTAAAVDVAVPGKFSPPAEGELRHEIAFDTSLLDQHKAAPAPSAAIHTGGAAPAQVTQAPVAEIAARVGGRGWDQGLGDKLVWMAGQEQQVAELHLNPPDLGPLKITLTLNHDQANAQFVSAHAQVREAIEAAMPRLREMLADSGITLGDASVSTGAFREQTQHDSRAYPAAPAAAAADPGALTRGQRLLRRSHGLVDTFA